MSKWVVLANCLLEIGCLSKIIEALTGQRGNRKNIPQYIIVAAILFVSAYINFYGGNRLLQLLHYVGLFAIFQLRYQMNAIDTVTYTLLSTLFVGALELLIYMPYNLLYSALHGKEDFSIIITLIVYLICRLLEDKKVIILNKMRLDVYKKKINIQLIIILFALAFIFILGFSKFGIGIPLPEGIYLSIALFMFLTMIYKLSSYQMEIDYHKRYANKYGEVITELRERQHKFINQLDSIYALCKVYDNYDELVRHQTKELDSLRKYLMPGKLLILERPLVVAHIYTKLCEAEEKQIDIHTDFSCSLEPMDVPDIFLIEILGNLLDNAIDEVTARKKQEKIRIAITDDGEEICFSIANEHDKIPYDKYSRFFQEGYSEKGNNRGVGLPYVKKIVDKFHGRIEVGNIIYRLENYFIVRVYFKR